MFTGLHVPYIPTYNRKLEINLKVLKVLHIQWVTSTMLQSFTSMLANIHDFSANIINKP